MVHIVKISKSNYILVIIESNSAINKDYELGIMKYYEWLNLELAGKLIYNYMT